MVVGSPGVGKSGASILLLLDILVHRENLKEDTERARVPVPVLITGYGWDPNKITVQEWLRDQMVATYPLLQGNERDAEAAKLVAARDKVVLILDGFDEMDENLRAVALKALSAAPFRVVMLTRDEEMVKAAAKTWLAGAIAVHLDNVSGAQAADYLEYSRTGRPPAGWSDLLSHLRQHTDSVLAQALSTPLTLTLVRDTYKADDDVGELLDTTRFSTSKHLERYLTARTLPAAYAPQPGMPSSYSAADAHQVLAFIARKMRRERDLVWWHIPHWANPTFGTIFLVFPMLGGILGGLALWKMFEFSMGAAFAIVVFLAAGGMYRRILGTGGRQQATAANWRAVLSPKIRGVDFVIGISGGLGAGAAGAHIFGLMAGLIMGVLLGCFQVLAIRFVRMHEERGVAEGPAVGPREAWRSDRVAGLRVGLAIGLALGPTLGMAAGLSAGIVVGLISAFVVVVGGVVVGGLTSLATWLTTLSWLQLRRVNRLPAVRLIAFLEDARGRGILRTVGIAYQFRHATLQDYLAEVPQHDQSPAEFDMNDTGSVDDDSLVSSPSDQDVGSQSAAQGEGSEHLGRHASRSDERDPSPASLHTAVWLVTGLSDIMPGILELVDECLSFDADNRGTFTDKRLSQLAVWADQPDLADQFRKGAATVRIFSATLAEVQATFPRYHRGSGMNLKVRGREHIFRFVLHSKVRTRDEPEARKAAAAIAEGRNNAEAWKAVLTHSS